MKITFDITISVGAVSNHIQEIEDSLNKLMQELGYDEPIYIANTVGTITMTVPVSIGDKQIQEMKEDLEKKLQLDFPKYKIKLIRKDN